MKIWRRVLIAVACAAIASVPAIALAQYGGGTPAIQLKDSSGQATNEFAAGERGSATATNLDENERYDLDFAQSPGVIIGSGTSNASGTLVAAFTIPSSANNGSATLAFLDSSDDSDAQITLQITGGDTDDDDADDGTSTGGSLPDTGASADKFVGLGVVLLVAGAAILLGLRLRRETERA